MNQYLTYTRESVCAADDYINRELRINLTRLNTLENLVDYILHYHDESGYAAIPYTGGDADWLIMDGDTPLAQVNDDGRIVSFCGNDPRKSLTSLTLTKLRGRRV